MIVYVKERRVLTVTSQAQMKLLSIWEGSVCVGITPCSPTDIADLVQPANIAPAFSLLDASQDCRSYHKQDVTLLTLPKYTVIT